MKRLLLIPFIILGLNAVSQDNKNYLCSWHNESGDVFKVRYEDFINAEKDKLYYYLENDSNNIYLYIRISDEKIKQQVLTYGITVWINADGKKSKKTGVKYPAGPQDLGKENPSGVPVGQLKQENQSGLNQKANPGGPGGSFPGMNSLVLYGFNKPEPVLVPADGREGFKGIINYQKGYTMFYELVLPIAKLPPINKSENADKMLVLGISYTPPVSFGAPGGGKQGGGMPGGGMPGGGRSGGGVPGGKQGGAPPSDLKWGPGSLSTTTVWIKNIKLATPK